MHLPKLINTSIVVFVVNYNSSKKRRDVMLTLKKDDFGVPFATEVRNGEAYSLSKVFELCLGLFKIHYPKKQKKNK